MATILTKEQINALYGFENNEEAVAFGARIKHSVPHTHVKRLRVEDLEPGSKEHTEFWERVYKLRSTPEQLTIESEVTEIL